MEISVYSYGQQQYDIKPLASDYTDSLYIHVFNTHFAGTGKLFKDEASGISPSTYPQGNALYVFELSPDLAELDHFT